MSDQQHHRVVRYLWTMAVRTACFVLAAVIHNWWSVAFLVGAVLLPWVAVVFANSGTERRFVPDTYLDDRSLEGPAEDDDGSSEL